MENVQNFIAYPTIFLILVFCAVFTTTGSSQGCEGGTSGCQLGAWQLDESKSKIPAGAPKNRSVVYEAAGDSITVTVAGESADGKPVHNEWTGHFDGKDYPVTGDPNSDTRSYKKIDERTLDLTVKKGGKIVSSGRIVVSPDGKTRTVTTFGTNAEGKGSKTVSVYNKH